jgi:RNA polymerase sigma factor (sigma-70 family)
MAASESRVAEVDRSFELLYRAHRRDVYNFVLHDVRNPDEAEDVTQVAFLNAYRALRGGRPPEKPRAWLLTIAQNVSRRRFRRRSARIREVPLDTELTVAAPDDYDGPTADEICAAFRTLPDNQRSALAMRELQGRSYAEIADELDLTVPAVETLIFRARRAVRKQLELEEGKLRALLLGPLALPGLIAKAVGSVTGSMGRFGLGAKTAGLAGALVVAAGAIEFAPPILAAEDPPAVVEIAPAKARAPAFVAEPRAAAETGAGADKAAKAPKGAASTKGDAAKKETPAGSLPNLTGQTPPALPAVQVPPVNVPAPPAVVLPPIEVPQLPPPPVVVLPPIEVPDLPAPPLPPAELPDLPPVP